MALPATSSLADRTSSPTTLDPAALNLSSNNPFRNRLSTASASPPLVEPAQQTFFPNNTMSKNPFLDPVDSGAPKTEVNGSAPAVPDDIFNDLSLLDKPAPQGTPAPRGPPARSGTMPTQPRTLGPDDARPPPRGPPRGPGSSPVKRPVHRRRASETSVTEKERQERRDRRHRERGERPQRTESEERRRRERRKEREERYKREGREPDGRRRKPKHLDLIDKLDVTGVYGQGLFHHDGPFDACNPNRNAKRDQRAPMQAFPEGSANMAMGGAGPLNSRLDLDKFHGRGEEGFQDYGQTRRKAETNFFNPKDRIEQVHGDLSHGLGTSTFLEGAPASKRALERRESEDQTTMPEYNMSGGGLQRKKSLAQRLRGMSASQRRPNGAGIRSPEARYNGGDASDRSPPRTKAVSAGGPSRAHFSKENEINLFDNEYEEAFEKKGTQIKIAEQEKPNVGRAREPTSPQANDLTRSVTTESAVRSGGEEEKPIGGGLLNRMKSLKGGGRRMRPERKDSNT